MDSLLQRVFPLSAFDGFSKTFQLLVVNVPYRWYRPTDFQLERFATAFRMVGLS